MSVTSKTSFYTRRSIIAAATGLAACALTGNRATAQDDDSALPDAADGLDIIAPIAPPALKFTDASGRKLSLSAYKGHVLVVNLWATWCGPCVEELPTLDALAAAIRPSGALVLPISIDLGGARTVQPFYALHKITSLPVLLNPDGDDLDLIGTDGVPYTLIINQAGNLTASVEGAGNWNTKRIQTYLRSLHPAPRKVPVPHVEAI